MPPRRRLIQLPLAGKIFLCVLAIVYQIYLVALVNFLHNAWSTPAPSVVVHQVTQTPESEMKQWTPAQMNAAVDATAQDEAVSNLTQKSSSVQAGAATRQKGQASQNTDAQYPLSTVGRIFFTNAYGQASSCSGTAVTSANRSVVDTAGHCLYWRGGWSQNLIFCPLYDHGATPYGCWAARDLEVPDDWINARPDDYHHDLGIAVVAANSQGLLTDQVGGVGWAYNQAAEQAFSAYGYPAGAPFDGQSRRSCEGPGTAWAHGEGTVVSIPCDMTGGSSGGPWFIQIGGNWYLNGHNDFISRFRPNHMYSPYYDDTWHALYDRAQHT